MKYPVIALTSGDINGIGLEVALKTLNSLGPYSFTPLLICPPHIVESCKEGLNFELPYRSITADDEIEESGELQVLSSPGLFTEPDISPNPGHITKEAGRLAMESVDGAIHLCLEGTAGAMVTAPISKEAIQLAGYDFPGHTEYLVQKTHTSTYAMMLVNEGLRVVPCTIHIPIKDVAAALSQYAILSQLKVIDQSLREDFGLATPAIAVLGLNPHAGDGGIIGDEEQKTIEPAIEHAKKQGLDVEGPFPADGFFGSHAYKEYDAILSMYHDQGLVPFKTLTFNKGVNFTAGLPIVRTSPDHGTAFGIAGQNRASAGSYREALELAVTLSAKRTGKQPGIRD